MDDMDHEGCVGGWRVKVGRDVGRWLRRHPEARNQFAEALEGIRANPYLGKPLHGRCRGFYKLRRGRLRVIYWIDHGSCAVRVVMVGYRERVYDEIGC